ncbi:MAG: hypothetical protein HPY55_09280 [Firmicutes bacterium]|nr:hypothetical protein [Bacillota bacterium]
MEHLAYCVPLIDVTWAEFGPLNPRKNYSVGTPPLALCHEEIEKMTELMKKLVGGRFTFAAHTGTYCRDAFLKEPFLGLWRNALTAGAEVLVHTHEEIAGKGTLYGDKDHMEQVVECAYRTLSDQGVRPVGYRGGLYAYAPFMTELLESLGLFIDMSAAPGVNEPSKQATWAGAPYSAYYLCRVDKTHGECGDERSKVLEIPLGADGFGGEQRNVLYVDGDLQDLDNLNRIWDTITGRARNSGTPQIIHFLVHTITASNPSMLERLLRFVDHIDANGGTYVTPTQAKSIYDNA